jgi:redox-sensitive bicupin YhaK (pirin superfamily)
MTDPTASAADCATGAADTPVTRPRSVERLVVGQPTSDGAGVKLDRLLGTSLHRRLDPFLMLDAFRSDDPRDYLAGFPDHPHRGFETITYMLAGRMRHRDSAGHEGLLEAGGVQWMTAGRGVIHSELPEQREGRMEGFQLWLNLPARDKLREPWYRDFGAADLPRFAASGGVRGVVIAGRCHGVDGAVRREATDPLIVDLTMPAGTAFATPLPPVGNAFLVVHRGAVDVGGMRVPAGRLAILANDPASDGVALASADGASVLLIAGRPLNEPIVQHGPFVMNTAEQIREAVRDYQAGRFAA